MVNTTVMIHVSKIFELAATHREFSIVWVDSAGCRVEVRDATCTSVHSSGSTMNVKCLSSGEIRKVNKSTVVEFNGEEVVL